MKDYFDDLKLTRRAEGAISAATSPFIVMQGASASILGSAATSPFIAMQGASTSILGSAATSPFIAMPGFNPVASKDAFTEGLYPLVDRSNKRTRFEVWLPLQFNGGKAVPAEMLEEVRRELLELFEGVSWENSTWGGRGKMTEWSIATLS